VEDKKDLGITVLKSNFSLKCRLRGPEEVWKHTRQTPIWEARGNRDGLPTILMENWNGSYIDTMKEFLLPIDFIPEGN